MLTKQADTVHFINRKEMLMMTGLIPFDAIDDFFGGRRMQDRNPGREIFKLDVKDADTGYTIEADLPGVLKKEVNLNADDKTLSISVNREESADEANGRYLHKERRFSSMSRSVRLPDANFGEVKAKLLNGVLVVNVPKKDKASDSRRIEIE